MKCTQSLIFCAIVLLMGSVTLAAQSNLVLDELLEEDQASFGNAVYITLTASGLAPDEISPEEAVEVLEQQNWGVTLKRVDEPITLGEISFLFMRAFEMKGGIMYRLFPGPRYASRELAYWGFIVDDSSASRIPSGEEALGILGNVLEWKEGQS